MTIFLTLLSLVSFAVVDKTAAVEKQLLETSTKVCETFYIQFAKEYGAMKKITNEEKSGVVKECISKSHAASQACAKTMISKVAALNNRKAKPQEIREKMNKEIQPELQNCLVKSNNKAQEEILAKGKAILAKKK